MMKSAANVSQQLRRFERKKARERLPGALRIFVNKIESTQARTH